MEKIFDLSGVGQAPQVPVASRTFGLAVEDQERYLRIIANSLEIRRHYELFLWLQGEIQAFLPHEIMVSAWGNFSQQILSVDVISSLPGVRTSALAQCDMDAFLKTAHARWVKAGRVPVVFCAAEVMADAKETCACSIHAALRTMRSIVVHGVRDERGSPESIYIALHIGSLTQGRPHGRFSTLVDSLIAPIDIAYRKVGALPPTIGRSARRSNGDWLDLTIREQQILNLVCGGKTNIDIAARLAISPFTVKNHVQRIFRKINVTNRTEAAAKYNQAAQEVAKFT